MLIQRRNFLIGLASLFAAPAIVRIESIMPVRALVLPVDDPLTMGIRYQTWPFGTTQPETYASGSITPQGRTPKPISHWLKALEKHREIHPSLVWEPMPDWRKPARVHDDCVATHWMPRPSAPTE
jgi:hypothetical protein